MRALHPYEYTYFNRLVAGGMEQANQRFEMEYWGTSFLEAADWLNEYYRPVGGDGDCLHIQLIAADG